MNVKAALGLPNVALHADATPGYDSAWCREDQWPQAATTTGMPALMLSYAGSSYSLKGDVTTTSFDVNLARTGQHTISTQLMPKHSC